MKKKNVFVAASTTLILLLLAACTALKPTPTQPAPTAEIPPDTGIEYHFVTNKLMLPTTQSQTQEFALNIDGDSQQNLDNKIGDLLTLLVSSAPGLELQSTLDQVVNSGQLVTLHMVKADDSLNDPSVLWSLFLGQKTQSAPSFNGSDQFLIDSAMPTDSSIVGALTNGHFTGGPGSARIQVFLLGLLVDVDLIGVYL